jgi:hypothetical protein
VLGGASLVAPTRLWFKTFTWNEVGVRPEAYGRMTCLTVGATHMFVATVATNSMLVFDLDRRALAPRVSAQALDRLRRRGLRRKPKLAFRSLVSRKRERTSRHPGRREAYGQLDAPSRAVQVVHFWYVGA